MSVEGGEWIMRGVSPDDPTCIHTIDELEQRVEEIGFLPLFAGDVASFSVEEHTVPEDWWTGDPAKDPWEWRAMVARRGRVAYGKFFDNRAGFISRKWLPVFANYRRDGYDFDARWDDELASIRQKKIMDLFLEENEDSELLSSEVKARAGFGKGGEKNFEGTLTGLQMQTYLICRDFRQRKNKKGEPYGWAIAVLATPEHVFGRELVTAAYSEEPKDSLKKIADRVKLYFPEATDRGVLKLVGYSEDRPSGRDKVLPYPQNLLKMIDRKKDPWSWTKDQISGLYVALGQLRPKQQKVLWEKYHDGRKNEEIGLDMNHAAGTISTYHGKAMRRLRSPLIAAWYTNGYALNLKACAAGEQWTFPITDPQEEISEEDLCLRLGLQVAIFERLAGKGIISIRDLEAAILRSETWYKNIYGVGAKTAEDIEWKMRYFGFL
ncbi:MAG: hypothetical protein ACI4DT_01360 [Chordicoccus sp.]